MGKPRKLGCGRWALASTVLLGLVFLVFGSAPGSASAATGWTGLVLNAITTSDSVTPFSTATNVPGSPVSVGGDHPTAAVITPDGHTAWVLLPAPDSSSDASLAPVDLTQSPPSVGSSVDLTGATSNTQCTIASVDFLNGADRLTLNPAGTKAYVADFITDSVYPVDLTQSPPSVGTAISLPAGSHPDGLAVTPDGTSLFVSDSGTDKISVISTASETVSSTIDLAAGAEPNAIAMAPDGSTAYVSEGGLGRLLPVALPAGTLGTPITVGAGPNGIAITPDGSKVYVTSGGNGPCPGITPANNVTPVSTATGTAGTAISMTGPVGPAATPDGATVYVPQGATGSSTDVVPVATQTNTAGTAINGGDWPWQAVIAPDQSPVASFTTSILPLPAGAVSFNASASSAPVGTIASYHWDFGDGSQETTTSPSTTHVYSPGGTYTARLTVTDSAGTSTARVFTGQMVLRNGGASATTTRSVTFPSTASQLLQMAPTDLQLARTIYTQIARNALRLRFRRWTLLQNLQAQIFAIQQDVTVNQAKIVDKEFCGLQGYVNGKLVTFRCPAAAAAKSSPVLVRGSTTCEPSLCPLTLQPTAVGRRLIRRHRSFNVEVTFTTSIPGDADGNRLVVGKGFKIRAHR